MSADFRALCADLLWALENAIRVIYHEDGTKHISTANPIVNRARAALADEPAVPQSKEPASVTRQPSDEELLDLLPQGNESGFWLPKGLPSDWVDGEFIAPPKAIIAFARDVLELWGNPTPQPPADGEVAEVMGLFRHWAEAYPDSVTVDPYWLTRAAELLHRQAPVQPADGEVAGLVAKLRRLAPQNPLGTADPTITRAADLLQRQVLVQVPAAERPWEREGWCDELGRCWWGRPDTDDWSADWTLATPEAIDKFWEFSPQTVCLPAHALPLPEVGA